MEAGRKFVTSMYSLINCISKMQCKFSCLNSNIRRYRPFQSKESYLEKDGFKDDLRNDHIFFESEI